MPPEAAYTIADLARLTGLNVRTIRYYIAQGLIPASGESGPGAHYGEGHLGRLRLTRRLQQQHLPLAEIRDRLASLSDTDVMELVTSPAPAAESASTSALEYVRGLLGHSDMAREPMPLPADVAREPMPADGDAAMPAPLVSAADSIRPSDAPPSDAPPSDASRRGFLRPAGFKAGRTGPSLSARIASKAQGTHPDHERVVASLAEDTIEPGTPAGVLPEGDLQAGGLLVRDVPATDVQARDMPARDMPERPGTHPATAPERSQWERHALAPNIELHVRRPLSRIEQRRVERLITIARQVLKEDGV